MAVNLAAPFLLGQGFGPSMAARGWGRIVNVTSAAGPAGLRQQRRVQGVQRRPGRADAFAVEAWARSGLLPLGLRGLRPDPAQRGRGQ